MLTADKIYQSYERAYPLFLEENQSSEPEWYMKTRRQGFECWQRSAFLTQKSEDWKYSDKTGFFSDTVLHDLYPLNSRHSSIKFNQNDLGFNDLGIDTVTFVIVDGIYSFNRGHERLINGGIQPYYAHELAHANHQQLLKSMLAFADLDGFAQLNQAFHPSALVIQLDALQPDTVVYLNHCLVSSGVNYPRLYLTVAPHQKLTVVEHFHSTGLSPQALTNAATFLNIEDQASVNHIKLIDYAPQCQGVCQTYAHLARQAELVSTTLNLGGETIRSQQQINLVGRKAKAMVDGVLLGKGHEVCDNLVVLNHRAPETESESRYFGLANDHSVITFNGRIHMESKARQANAALRNTNVLLSSSAHVNTKPELEIYANDVKCAHGATVGKIDPKQLLYLRSRGLSLSQAKQMMTEGFANQGIQNIPLALRSWAQRKLTTAISNMVV